ncbi:hypothetical protein Tco_0736086 [Tanacetum coccineum]
MERAMEQHRLKSKTFEVKKNKTLHENERLLEQVISKDIVNIIMNSSVDNASVNVHECEKCLKLKIELLNNKDFIAKETYDKLFRNYTTLEKYCISLEVDTQLNRIFFKEKILFQIKEKDLVITALKNDLRKLKGKDLADNVVTKHLIAPEILKIDVEPIALRLLNNRTAHFDYLRHTQEQAAILREIVEQGKSQNPLNNSLDSALKPSTSASGSQPSGNTKKDKIQQTPSRTQKNKVEAHPKTFKYSLKNKNCFVETKGNANVQHSKLNAHSELLCVKCNGCMLSDNYDMCVLDFINDVNARIKSKSVKKIRNACPLTRITTTAEVPLRKPTALENDTPKPVVVQIVLWYFDSDCSKHMTEDRSQLTNFVNKFLGTIKFRYDHVAKILGYSDYQIGNVMIPRVYYVEGLGHNLFSVGKFCDSNLEVAFRQHTCFIRNLEEVVAPKPAVSTDSLLQQRVTKTLVETCMTIRRNSKEQGSFGCSWLPVKNGNNFEESIVSSGLDLMLFEFSSHMLFTEYDCLGKLMFKTAFLNDNLRE